MSEFTGIFISKEILEIPNLPFFHKGVLAQIVALSKTDGYCRATDGYLARLFQVERSNINRTINKLFASGYVHIDTDPKSGNKRTITPIINSTQPLYQNDTTPIINSTQPLYQNDTTIYNDESKEESKVLNQRLNDNTGGEVFKNSSSLNLEEKGGTPPKAPQVAPAPPNGLKAQVADAAKFKEHTFEQDELFDFDVFEGVFTKDYPELDPRYYYMNLSSWIDKKTGKPAKRKIWKSVLSQFVMNDYKRGSLQFKNAATNAAAQNTKPPQRSNKEIILQGLKNVLMEDAKNGHDITGEIPAEIANLWT